MGRVTPVGRQILQQKSKDLFETELKLNADEDFPDSQITKEKYKNMSFGITRFEKRL